MASDTPPLVFEVGSPFFFVCGPYTVCSSHPDFRMCTEVEVMF
jgi:hypothetical protein